MTVVNENSPNIIRLLLIEDNELFAESLKLYLTSDSMYEYHVFHATNLADGLVKQERFNFNIILLDFTLPDSDGYRSIQALKSIKPDVPIVILTGYDDNDRAMNSVNLGAQDFLSKSSISPEKLQRAIFNAMTREKKVSILSNENESLKNVIQLEPEIDHDYSEMDIELHG
ncbi:response regulator [bacterium]|jgi:DNA-binding NarL/FixJ family response regulator|nr:response regulator [bacterium]